MKLGFGVHDLDGDDFAGMSLVGTRKVKILRVREDCAECGSLLCGGPAVRIVHRDDSTRVLGNTFYCPSCAPGGTPARV